MVENPVSTGQDIIPRGDTQRAKPIASRPCSADLINLANSLGQLDGTSRSDALAEISEKARERSARLSSPKACFISVEIRPTADRLAGQLAGFVLP
jgi:hypothetical protein